MPAAKNINDITKTLSMTEQQVKSAFLLIVDFLISNDPSEDAIENGMYHLPSYVGESSFIEAYKETLWASYQDAVGDEIDKKIWVNVSPKGIYFSVGRE